MEDGFRREPPRSILAPPMTGPDRRFFLSSRSSARVRAAAAWLDTHPHGAEVLVIGPSWEACDDLVRTAADRAGARFGVVRLTFDRLAARLAAPALARARRAPVTAFSLEAVAARAVHLLAQEKALSYFTPVATQPGFPRAGARTLAELRMTRIPADAIAALPFGGDDLAAIAARVEEELAAAGLADRAAIHALAEAAAAARPAPHPVGLP